MKLTIDGWNLKVEREPGDPRYTQGGYAGGAAAELQRILRRIVQQLDVSDGEVIKDVNGNTVGEWDLMIEDEEDENESLFDREFSYPVEDFEL